MANIVALKTRADQTNEDAISVLKEFLQDAEKGEIVSIAIAAIEPGGSSRTSVSKCDHLQQLLGALAILQFRMIESRDQS